MSVEGGCPQKCITAEVEQTMKRLRQLLFLLACCCLVLPPGVLKKARAQNTPADGKKVFDNYFTVKTMVYPPAGASFKVAKEMLDLFGSFVKSLRHGFR
jgi:hypothetical protein